MTDNRTLWGKCLEIFARTLTDKQMKVWLHPLEVKKENRTLSVCAPNKFIRDSVQKNFFSLIKNTVLRESAETIQEVLLTHKKAALDQGSFFKKNEGAIKIESPGLNKDLSFASFVEGKSNQLAKAACLSVASDLGQYNPLYIYGGVGLGKTHLLHSIGNAILFRDPKKRVVYLHSEKFVQNMVTALRQNKIEGFKKFYRSVDALLIDDIQFFAGKERSQEEFFHTFNSLFEFKKQVVLTSDKYPKEIDGLEERLKSRFVWGMNVSIDPPDLETRVAILHSKSADAGTTLPEDVAFFLAKNIYSNIRELEGSLRRVIATAHFSREEITLSFAKETLKDLLSLQERLLTIEAIQKRTAEYYKIRVADILSTKRDKKIAHARHMAMALAKDLTSHSLPSIGDSFGGRDHTTVIHACKKIQSLKSASSSVMQDYKNLMHALNY